MPLGARLAIFAVLAAAIVGAVVIFAVHRRKIAQDEASRDTVAVATAPATATSNLLSAGHLFFRNTARGPSYGHVAAVTVAAPDGERIVTPIVGDRVYGAAGTIFVLRAHRRALTTYEADSFGADFAPRRSFELPGAPSRTRVSPNGHLAVSTVFVTGDSYNSGGFSTRTTLYDLPAGKVLGDLEDFAVEKDGQSFKKTDFNFWGLTFAADNDRFFATVASGGTPFLIEGSITQRRARVIKEVVECPSISPDGTRVAYKHRLIENGRFRWSIQVYDLAAKHDTIVNETHTVDDQVEWLDNSVLLYALPRPGGESDIWAASADGSGQPRKLVSDASSPCVIRP
ncbi:MAG TPA: hypothetical protein VHD32_00440 [Candidatus Didemnitutus sp.]|nr:hypothetical protein [Candidatus Didemnitutus sp.]